MSPWAEFLNNTGRTIHKWKHYFPAYERHFGRFVDRPVTFLEIGCGEGGSLQLWKRYFGPHARIVGVDIRPECVAFEEDQIAIRIGDQSDPAFLKTLIDEFGSFDVILDDGSHVMTHIGASFAYLYPRMSSTGVYMVEDLHTAPIGRNMAAACGAREALSRPASIWSPPESPEQTPSIVDMTI